MRIIYSAVLLIVFLNFINLASAVAISGIYSEENPLGMHPGESKEIIFTLQNMAGSKDVRFRANITEGFEIAELADESQEYLVPLHSNNISVRIRIEIPEEEVSGEIYNITIKFLPVSIGDEEKGMVQLALGLSRHFNVRVVEKPREKISKEETEEEISILWIILWLVVVAAATAIIYFIIWKIRKNKISGENI